MIKQQNKAAIVAEQWMREVLVRFASQLNSAHNSCAKTELYKKPFALETMAHCVLILEIKT